MNKLSTIEFLFDDGNTSLEISGEFIEALWLLGITEERYLNSKKVIEATKLARNFRIEFKKAAFSAPIMNDKVPYDTLVHRLMNDNDLEGIRLHYTDNSEEQFGVLWDYDTSVASNANEKAYIEDDTVYIICRDEKG